MRLRVRGLDAACRMVALGAGVAVVPEAAARHWDREGVGRAAPGRGGTAAGCPALPRAAIDGAPRGTGVSGPSLSPARWPSGVWFCGTQTQRRRRRCLTTNWSAIRSTRRSSSPCPAGQRECCCSCARGGRDRAGAHGPPDRAQGGAGVGDHRRGQGGDRGGGGRPARRLGKRGAKGITRTWRARQCINSTNADHCCNAELRLCINAGPRGAVGGNSASRGQCGRGLRASHAAMSASAWRSARRRCQAALNWITPVTMSRPEPAVKVRCARSWTALTKPPKITNARTPRRTVFLDTRAPSL